MHWKKKFKSFSVFFIEHNGIPGGQFVNNYYSNRCELIINIIIILNMIETV